MNKVVISLWFALFTTYAFCAQRDPALERAIRESKREYEAHQKAQQQRYQRDIETAIQQSLHVTSVMRHPRETIKTKTTPEQKRDETKVKRKNWWQKIKDFWTTKSTPQKKTPKAKIKEITSDPGTLFIYDWSPYAYRQRDGISCGLHSIKNGYHVAQYLRSRQFEGDYDAAVKSIASEPHNNICKFGYPLGRFKQSLKLRKEEPLKEMLVSDNVYSSAQEVFGLTKKDLTVITSTENFEQSNFDLGFFTRKEQQAIQKLKQAVKNKRPIIHIFILGNMREIETKTGIYGTSGHWIALVVEVHKQGTLSLHYINSFGANRSDMEYKTNVIRKLLSQ